jgi:hypothetical protein
VKEHEPRHVVLEVFFNYGDASESLVFKGAQKGCTSVEDGSKVFHEPLDTVRPVAFKSPSLNIDVSRAIGEFAVHHLKEGLDVL